MWLKGGGVSGFGLLVMFFFTPPPRLLEGGAIWQKYLPMVIICRIMCIMEAIIGIANL